MAPPPIASVVRPLYAVFDKRKMKKKYVHEKDSADTECVSKGGPL
jgi:hypothetical protein